MGQLFSGLGAIANNPLTNLILSLFGGVEQNRLQGEANASNKQLENEIRQVFGGRAQDVMRLLGRADTETQTANRRTSQQANALANQVGGMARRQTGQTGREFGSLEYQTRGQFDQLAEQLRRGYAQRADATLGRFAGAESDVNQMAASRASQIPRDFDQRMSAVQSMLQDRYQRGLSTLEGAGQQERADIDTRFQAVNSANQADALSRGLSATSLVPSMALGTEREKSGEIGRLNERLLQQRLGLDAALSGDIASAAERAAGTSAGLRSSLTGEQMGARERQAGNFATLQGMLTGEGLSAGERIGTNRITSGMGLGTNRVAANSADRQNLLTILDSLGRMQLGVQGVNADRTANTTNQRLGYQSALPFDFANWLNSITTAQPDPNMFSQLLQSLGRGSAQPVQAPSQQWAGPLIQGGLGLGGALGSAAILAPALAASSDRYAKENFAEIDDEAIGAAVEAIEITEWNYIGDEERHIGPMAQDFQQLFGYGNGREIHVIDAMGILFSAVKHLTRRIHALETSARAAELGL